ncbi:MAG TPA: RNA 2',3'-cyclic phosphodiesterase [Rhodospirillales bacterium]|nr:RNA 2',3'-cyclic phosphodiesterase [Rhodospirillales bacterium]
MPRLFVALAMPEPVAEELDRLCSGLPGVRWTYAEQFHLTLRFIGEVDPTTFCEIGEALASVSLPPFEMRLKGIGQFPPRGMPHTLWAGVEEAEPVVRLRRRIERVLNDLGLAPERRKFVPHVTLGRVREPLPRDRFGSFLARRALFRSSPFPVSRFGLYSSVLRPQGAEHLLEAEYDFVTGVMERA